MPRIKYIPVEPPNLLRDMFKRYAKAQNITSAELGAKLGKSAGAVRMKLHGGKWDNEEVRLWCKALNITNAEEVGKAVMGVWY